MSRDYSRARDYGLAPPLRLKVCSCGKDLAPRGAELCEACYNEKHGILARKRAPQWAVVFAKYQCLYKVVDLDVDGLAR